jgi:hypothetical protein
MGEAAPAAVAAIMAVEAATTTVVGAADWLWAVDLEHRLRRVESDARSLVLWRQ